MTPKISRFLCSLFAVGAAVGLSSCASSSQPRLDAKTSSILQAMSDKLAAAKTLRVTAARTASPGFYIGFDVAENAQVTAVVSRPNKLRAEAETNLGKRSVGYDGKTVTFIDHKAGTHAQVKAGLDLEDTARSLQNTYGVMPPLVELLANHPREFLLEGVTRGEFKGMERIGGSACDHLAFKQERLEWDIWVDSTNLLPKKMVIKHPNGEGGPPLQVTLTIEKWELNAAMSPADLALSIPKGSTSVAMLPLTNP